jgi:hypothetical protein
MVSSDASTVIPMKVLVEEDIVAPVGILLEGGDAAIQWAIASVIG